MTPIAIIITLIVVGIVLWLINMIPMPVSLKSAINTLVILLIIWWFLVLFGVITITGYENLKMQ